MKTETIMLAQHGGFYDSQHAAAILLRKMEIDCASRGQDEAGALRPIVERAKTFMSRMAFVWGKGHTNNRRKFMDAWYDYAAATGLVAA